jgi:hypothetical protein
MGILTEVFNELMLQEVTTENVKIIEIEWLRGITTWQVRPTKGFIQDWWDAIGFRFNPQDENYTRFKDDLEKLHNKDFKTYDGVTAEIDQKHRTNKNVKEYIYIRRTDATLSTNRGKKKSDRVYFCLFPLENENIIYLLSIATMDKHDKDTSDTLAKSRAANAAKEESDRLNGVKPR